MHGIPGMAKGPFALGTQEVVDGVLCHHAMPMIGQARSSGLYPVMSV